MNATTPSPDESMALSEESPEVCIKAPLAPDQTQAESSFRPLDEKAIATRQTESAAQASPNAEAFTQYLAALNFQPDDIVCIARGSDKRLKQKMWKNGFIPFSGMAQDTFQQLTKWNQDGLNVYVSMAAFAPGTEERVKTSVSHIRHVFVEADTNGPEVLRRIDADVQGGLVPQPSVTIESSPGKVQIIWNVSSDDFVREGKPDIKKHESLIDSLRSRYQTDPASTDTARVLRIPGFQNVNYDTKPMARLITVGDRTAHHVSDFKIATEILAATVAPAAVMAGTETASLRTSPDTSPDGPPIPRGSHDNELHRIAGKLRYEGLDEEEILSRLLDICQARCINYGDDWQDMCQKHARNICRKPAGPGDVSTICMNGIWINGSLRGQPVGEGWPHDFSPVNRGENEEEPNTSLETCSEPLGTAVAKASAEIAAKPQGYQHLLDNLNEANVSWILQNVQKASELSSKPIEWVIEEMIFKTGLHLFSGKQGSMKSMLALILAKVIASGEPFVGRKNIGEKITVVYVDKENPQSEVRRRCAALGLLELENFRIWGDWQIENPPPLTFDDPRLLESARRDNAFFIFDSLSSFLDGADENATGEMMAIMGKARLLARTCSGVAILHHQAKNGSAGSRGNSAIPASTDMAFVVNKEGHTVNVSEERFRMCGGYRIKFEMDFGGLTGAYSYKAIENGLMGSGAVKTSINLSEGAPNGLGGGQGDSALIQRAAKEIEKTYTNGGTLTQQQLALLIGITSGRTKTRLLNGSPDRPWKCVSSGRKGGAVYFIPKNASGLPVKPDSVRNL